jgi:hypothetical protein
MATRNMHSCPICRQKINLCLIPDTNIIIDNYFEPIYKKKPQIKKSIKSINTHDVWYMTINRLYDVPKEAKYYDNDDSDYDSDNDGMN